MRLVGAECGGGGVGGDLPWWVVGWVEGPEGPVFGGVFQWGRLLYSRSEDSCCSRRRRGLVAMQRVRSGCVHCSTWMGALIEMEVIGEYG